MTKSWRRRRRQNLVLTGRRWRHRQRRLTVFGREHRGRLTFLKHQCDQETGREQRCLEAPKFFNSAQPGARTQLLQFLEEMRDAVERGGRSVYIDFSRTVRMYAAGTLLFYAEVDRLTRMRGSMRKIRCSYPNDKVVEQVLQQVGVFNAIGKPCRAKIDHDLVKHWHSATGTQVEGAKIEPVLKYYQGTVAAPLTTPQLYAGIVEAMANSREHAYVGTSADVHRRWWMFSQEKDGVLSVAFCDLGMGIPASLERKDVQLRSLDGLLARLGLTRSDAALIQAAFELGTTRTRDPNRGRGLQNVKEVLDHVGGGTLTIQSGYGSYDYKSGAQDPSIRNHPEPIPGTLIYWSLPVQSEGTSKGTGEDVRDGAETKVNEERDGSREDH